MLYQCPACRTRVPAAESTTKVLILCGCGHAIAVRGRRVILEPYRYLVCTLCRLPFPRPATRPGTSPRCPRPECVARTKVLGPVDALRGPLEQLFREMDDSPEQVRELLPDVRTCTELPGEVEVVQDGPPEETTTPGAEEIRKLLRAGLSRDELARELIRVVTQGRSPPKPVTVIDPA